jgi:hypothetical protein
MIMMVCVYWVYRRSICGLRSRYSHPAHTHHTNTPPPPTHLDHVPLVNLHRHAARLLRQSGGAHDAVGDAAAPYVVLAGQLPGEQAAQRVVELDGGGLLSLCWLVVVGGGW